MDEPGKVAFRCATCGSQEVINPGEIDLSAEIVLRFACGHELTQAQLREQAIEAATEVARDSFGDLLKPRR